MNSGPEMIAVLVAMAGALVYGFRMMVTRMCDLTKLMADMQSQGERIARLEAQYDEIGKTLVRIESKIDERGKR